jgi:hypothetical protein
MPAVGPDPQPSREPKGHVGVLVWLALAVALSMAVAALLWIIIDLLV